MKSPDDNLIYILDKVFDWVYGEVIGGNVTQTLRKCWISSDITELMLILKMEYAGELTTTDCAGD